MPPLLRLIHPAPAAAVIALAAALAAILAGDGAAAGWWRIALVATAVAGSQVVTGALNDWADRDRDAASGQDKPIPAGLVTPRAALRLATAGGLLQLAASLPLGAVFVLLGAAATLSAVAYDMWLSRTPLSVLPYLVSFGILPLWVASGVVRPAGSRGRRSAAGGAVRGCGAPGQHAARLGGGRGEPARARWRRCSGDEAAG